MTQEKKKNAWTLHPLDVMMHQIIYIIPGKLRALFWVVVIFVLGEMV